MKLQSCPKCQAQFDVSEFPRGHQFACGACGHVITAHATARPQAAGTARSRAPKGRAPAGRAPTGRTSGSGRAPRGGTARSSSRGSASGRVPGSGSARRAPSGGSPARGNRGPQFQPRQRGGSTKAGAPARRAASGATATRATSRRRGRGGDDDYASSRGRDRGRRASSGPNKALLFGGLAAVVLAGVLLAVLGGDKGEGQGDTSGTNQAGTSPNGGGTAVVAETPKETIRDVMADFGTASMVTKKKFQDVIARVKAASGDEQGRKNALNKVYSEFIKGPGFDDDEARAALGYMKFDYEVNIDIEDHDMDYIRGALAASKRKWFPPEDKEAYQQALEAKRKTELHEERYGNERLFRLGIDTRNDIATNSEFKEYHFASEWKAPFMVCYASKERVSEYDLLSIEDPAERKAKAEELRRKRKAWEPFLKEKATILKDLYDEWLNRFKEPLRLKDLASAYGGRDDLKPGKRSYTDGCPLVVWIFSDKAAFDDYHKKEGVDLPPGVAGYFSPKTGWVYLFDEEDSKEARRFEVNKNVHEGVHQLEYWFTRQRLEWGYPPHGQDFFGEGIAEWLGAVKMGADRKLEYIDVNLTRLSSMKQTQRIFKEQYKKDYPIFPLENLSSFGSYAQAQNWGAAKWGVSQQFVMGIFYEQSWAAVYFLTEYENGKYRKRFDKMFDLILHGFGGRKTGQAFREAFGIEDEEDWEEIEEEWTDYINDVLLKMPTAPYKYDPPDRRDTGWYKNKNSNKNSAGGTTVKKDN